MSFKLSDRFLITLIISAKIYEVSNKKRKLWKPKHIIDINDSIFELTETESWVSVEDNIPYCSYYLNKHDKLFFDKKSSTITLTHEFNSHRYDIHSTMFKKCNFNGFKKDFIYWLKSYMELSDNNNLCLYGDSLDLKIKSLNITFDIQLHPDLVSYHKSVNKKQNDLWNKELAAQKIQKFYRSKCH